MIPRQLTHGIGHEILPQATHVDNVERRLHEAQFLLAAASLLVSLSALGDMLPQHEDAWIMQRQGEKEQVGILASNAMHRRRVVAVICSPPPDVVHDLVLAFSGHAGIAHDHRKVLIESFAAV
eukprot:scaffold2720_cov212-Pinguiococcus_pyrenoidosus.AAC.7